MLAFNRNIALILAFDGSEYHGWQFQPNSVTVQGELEKAVRQVFPESDELIGVSRTDAGVSAFNYVCNFGANSDIPVGRIPKALNTYLPNNIVVKEAIDAREDFNSRFSTVSKTYRYSVLNMPNNSAFFYNNLWHVWPKLDLEKMREQSKHLIGELDFTSFTSSSEQRENKVRNIFNVEILNDGMISFIITGDGFLYNMVRIIVGTLVDIGLGKDYNIKEILKSKDRTKAGQTAPPNGLFLANIDYGNAL